MSVAVRGPMKESSRKSYDAVGGRPLARIRSDAKVRNCRMSG